MDSENIASVLKNAIHASSTAIQNESKQTKVFVLPPELLKGLLVKNEINKTDNINEAETLSSNSSKRKTEDKKKSLEKPNLVVELVTQTKRTSIRQNVKIKGCRNTRSQKLSDHNSKDLENNEQNYEQNIVSENIETSNTSKSRKNNLKQQKSNRGRKSKLRKEDKPSDIVSIEKTMPNKVEEKFKQNTSKLQDNSISQILDCCSDNNCLEKSPVRIPDTEETRKENNHELQNDFICEISNNTILKDNTASNEIFHLNSETKSCDETVKVKNSQTEIIDQVLKESHIKMSQDNASQKISEGNIFTCVEANEKNEGTFFLLGNQTQSPTETFIVEEIIEIEESDKGTLLRNKNTLDTPHYNNMDIDFEPPVEKRNPNTVKVYVNKKKNIKKASNYKIQEKSITEMNHNFDKNSLTNITLKETSALNSFEELQDSQKNLEKFNSEINCKFDQNSFINTTLIESDVKSCEELKYNELFPDMNRIDKQKKTSTSTEDLFQNFKSCDDIDRKVQDTDYIEENDNHKELSQTEHVKVETISKETKKKSLLKQETDNISNAVNLNTDVPGSKSNTDISSKNDELDKNKDFFGNEKDFVIKSLRQLRNRTKVIPQNSINQLRNNIKKESMDLRNSNNSNSLPKNDFEVNSRNDRTSYNLDPSCSQENLLTSTNKISRKAKSIDNYLESTKKVDRMTRRRTISEKETKLPLASKESSKIQSKKILSSEDVTNNDRSLVLNDIVHDNGHTIQNSESTVIQKTEETITPESTDKLNYNTGDLRNLDSQIQASVDKSSSSSKVEKVIYVKKMKKKGRTKSSSTKDNAAVKTEIEKDDYGSNKINNDLKVIDDTVNCNSSIVNNSITVEVPKDAENVIPIERDEVENLNCIPTDSSNGQMEISFEENTLSIQNEIVPSPKKVTRGRRSKSISSKITPQIESEKLPIIKGRRRGRPPKSSQIKDSIKETEMIKNNCTLSTDINNSNSKESSITEFEDTNKHSCDKMINIDLKVDPTTEQNTVINDNNLEPVTINDSRKDESEKCTSKLTRRTSRRDKQEEALATDISDIQISSEHNVEESIQYNTSSEIDVKCDIADDDDTLKSTEKNSRNVKLRKSGRCRKSEVNYCVPDENIDFLDNNEPNEKELSTPTPKRRRGRPRKIQTPSVNTAVEEEAEGNLEKCVQNDMNLEDKANDLNSTPTDTPGITTRKGRMIKRRTFDNDIFQTESESVEQEKLPGTPERLQPEHASDVTNSSFNFEDKESSEKDKDEDMIEESKPRRGRKRKCIFQWPNGRRRGRPKKELKQNNDDDYTPHHSYVPHPIKVKPKVDKTDKKLVKCGKCKKEMVKVNWYSHNLFCHNDMSWLDGTEQPDFENDQRLLVRVLTNAKKKKNKKGLTCETCRTVKKSVVGFISHMTFCGKTEEEITSLLVTCPLCGGTFKPSSMEYHERQHRLETEGKKKKDEEVVEKIFDPFEPRSKRKAAEKAVSRISEFTALVKDEDGFSAAKKLKLSSPHIKKFIQKPQAVKRMSNMVLVKWKKELKNNQNAACTQLGCQFTSKSLEEMRKHYASCNFTATENYVCKVCRYQTVREDEIIRHAAEKHSSEDFDINAMISDAESVSSEDYSDIDDVEDGSNQGPGLVKKFFYKETSDVANKLFKFIFNNGACHTVLNKTFLSGFQWTLEFERKHFKFSIFNDLTPNPFMLLDEKDAQYYLPELDLSMPVRFAKTDELSGEPEWKNWARFEASCIDDYPTFFVGGPVWALAWAPTPSFLAISDDLPQFLAVSTHPTMDGEYSTGQCYSGKNIIQIWSLGNLNNTNPSVSDPQLSYAIAHDGGTVWSLEWCPSGCYQHENFPNLKDKNDSNRLGLLAAGCSDGCVRIYSLIFPGDLPPSESKNKYPIYSTEPVIKLIVNTETYNSKNENSQVTKLCWSRQANHNVIIAGFSNGYVAFWDLTTKSPMLKYKVDDTIFFRPYKQFFAHHHAVTMVVLIPQGNKRYLATASLDKLYKFWDLEDVTKPKNIYKKSFVTDGSWFNNWCCAILAHDDALCMSHNSSVCLPLRDYTYKYYNMLPSNSTIYAIGTSDFGNSVATGTVAGELLTLFPHQLIYIRDMDKTIPPKRNYSLVSTTEIVDLKAGPANNPPVKEDKKENENEPYSDPAEFLPATYKDSKDRFGLQFSIKMNLFQNQSKKLRLNKKQMLNCEVMGKVPIEQYPLKSINKVTWNPNASSFLWLAAGYQNGFVRLVSFKSAASTGEWNKLLQLHTNVLKAQMARTTINGQAADDEC